MQFKLVAGCGQRAACSGIGQVAGVCAVASSSAARACASGTTRALPRRPRSSNALFAQDMLGLQQLQLQAQRARSSLARNSASSCGNR
jgi:hypothetical protein